jgi:hypothetical protein
MHKYYSNPRDELLVIISLIILLGAAIAWVAVFPVVGLLWLLGLV